MKRTAVHYALFGVNGMIFPICGFRNRSSLRWSGFIGEISCECCLSLLVEAGCLPSQGCSRKKRIRPGVTPLDESSMVDEDVMGSIPAGMLASFSLDVDDALLDF